MDKKAGVAIGLLLLPWLAHADWLDAVGVSAGAGVKNHGASSSGVSLLVQTGDLWSRRFDGGSELALLGEGAIMGIRQSGDVLWGVSVSPLLRWRFPLAMDGVMPYLQAGIGGAWFNRSRLHDTDLGSALQFVDQLGLGVAGKHWDAGLRMLHYSNGGLKQPNEGLNLVELVLLYRY